MARTIEAKAVISGEDKTGNLFDRIAEKLRGVERVAKSLEGIKPPKFVGNFDTEMARLKLTEKELQSVRKSFGELDQVLRSGGPLGAHNYFRAVDEWKTKTVGHWREVKASADEAEAAQKKFYKSAGHFARHTAAHALGGFGGAYIAGHAIKSVWKAGAARNREGIREEIAGFSPAEQEDAARVASEISRQYPSLSRTDVMEDLRKNTARLGSFDRAKEVAKIYAKARISNQIAGGDEHELEQVVRAAEGAGAANTPDQFKDFMNAWSKARSVNADYTGSDFAKDYRAATASKYGWDKDFRENVFPVLASHTPGLGVKMATANSALVGGRMTKQSKASLQEAGLLDKDGHLVDETGFQKNYFEWTQAHVRPFLERKGVKFGEDMSEDDKRTSAAFATKSFSARNVADAILAALVDAPLVEKARNRKTADIDAVDKLQHRDAGIAWQGVEKQAGDFGTSVANIGWVVGRMDSFALALGAFTTAIETGRAPLETRGGKFFAWLRGDEAPIEGKIPMPMADPRRMPDGTRLPMPMGDPRNRIPDFPDGVPMPGRDPRRLPDGTRIPMPMGDPRNEGESWTPPPISSGTPVQATLNGSASVEGELKQTITIEPSSWFVATMQRLESAVRLVGTLSTNGPGSTGTSSPEASAPKRPYTGAAFGP